MHVLYDCHPTAKETLRKHRDEIHAACSKHLHRAVRVQNLDGHVVNGTIVHLDRSHVYLAVQPEERETRPVWGYPYPRPPSPPYGPYPYPVPSPAGTILPLVLFELLTISLLA